MSQRPNTLASVRALPHPTRWLLLGIGLARVASFMIWPFIAVAMNQRFGTPITEIGAQLALGALISIALSPLSGLLGDRFNSRNLMLFGCALCASCYLLMGLMPGQTSYFAAIIGMALSQSILEPLLRMLLSDTAVDDAQRTFLFHIRYYVVNCAAAIGPLIGLWFANHQSDGVFAIAVCVYGVLTLTILNAAKARLRNPHLAKTASPPLRQIFRAVLGSKVFLSIIVANFFLVLVYAQLDEPLTFYLLQLSVDDINHIIAMMSFTNAAVVLVVHLFLMSWLIALADKTAYLMALGCLMVAHAIIAFNTGAWWAGWLFAVVFATFAEIIVMPLFGTLIDRLAPPGMRGSFIGISMLAGFGSALAPLLGAVVIAHFGGAVLFSALALACIPIGLLGYRVLRVSQPEGVLEPTP
ncbi:MFS transporter [Pseudomonas frederiksbergensis]|uniref:MFS transporter n=1 Tax=Pseudomonas frederiksbergensis TaxID=104087 RepID=A0A423KFI3_9PSED|nr:MFS transporter [Pseudomonas frederiksbergensis]RON51600.1 MFS transporter [Pseudomonas frederiksbergensis]